MKIKSVLYPFVVFLFLGSFQAGADDELVFAVTYIRHGYRAPYAKIDSPNFNYQWPDGTGALTLEGMHQEYLLGKEL